MTVTSGLLARVKRATTDLAQAAATPLVPADYLGVLSPLRGPDLRARVVGVRALTPLSAEIVLQPGPGWAGHRPGQYLRVGVDIDGVRHWRSYSITSRPDEGHVTIAVKAQGLVSDHLVGALNPADVVCLGQADGDFRAPGGPLLIVTAGSGITPVMGMLRSSRFEDAVLVHSDRHARDVMFGAELRARAVRGELRLIERHTGVEGRLSADELARLVPDLPGRRILVCGPNGLIDDVVAFCQRAELPAPVLERFRPVLAPAGSGGEVSFVRASKVAQADGGTSLLEAGEAAGILMPHGCRMGICYGCVTPLAHGTVRDLRDGAVTTADDEPVLIQTCINAAAGPCALDI